MNKVIKKIIFVFIVFSIFIPIQIVNAEGNGGFKIKKEIYGITNHVKNTFTYEVTNDKSNPAMATNLPQNIKVTIDDNPNSSNVVVGYGIIPGSAWESVVYPIVGTYKFIVQEVKSENPKTYPISKEKYYAYIYVSNEMDGSGNPTGKKIISYVGSKKEDVGNKISPAQDVTAGNNPKTNDESNYDNLYRSSGMYSYITIKNKTTGLCANSKKYFRYTIKIDGNKEDKYVISNKDIEVRYKWKKVNNNEIYTVGNKMYIYLKDGQEATIGKANKKLYQIPIGTKYTITSEKRICYQPSIKEKISKVKINPKDNVTIIVNKKVIEFLCILPIIILIILLLIVIKTYKKLRKKEDKEIPKDEII